MTLASWINIIKPDHQMWQTTCIFSKCKTPLQHTGYLALLKCIFGNSVCPFLCRDMDSTLIFNSCTLPLIYDIYKLYIAVIFYVLYSFTYQKHNKGICEKVKEPDPHYYIGVSMLSMLGGLLKKLIWLKWNYVLPNY